jgi:hypothetical protein
MYSDEEKIADDYELYSSDADNNNNSNNNNNNNNELDIVEISNVFDKIIGDFLYLEPMLNNINFSDICYESNYKNLKSYETHFNKKVIFELSYILNKTIQKFARDYDDVYNVLSDISQHKIYSRIVRSFNRYYVLH